MDVLSEVLKVVRVEAAVFYNAEFSSPWRIRSPSSQSIAPYLASRTGHVVIYHLVTEGPAAANVIGGAEVPLVPGDIVIFPHGDAHLMGNGPPVEPVDHEHELGRILAQGLTHARMGGGGEVTRLICGYLVCDSQLSRPFLSGLPPLLKVNIRDDASGKWLEDSIRFSVGDAGASQEGRQAVLARLSEALFVETLRRHIARLPQEEKGWLAGARDPQVGAALALLHREPGHDWTIAELAVKVGVSRSVLAERFRDFLGEPPLTYLTRWRLQLGARLLASTMRSVAEVAGEVGYESEAGFNRAFKREFGLPPARYRKNAEAAAAG